MIIKSDFGSGPRGEPVHLFTLGNPGGIVARVTNYGGIVTQLLAPDRRGRQADVVLGFDSIGPYLGRHAYFGAIVGRVAGRLTPPSFSLGGRSYALTVNQSPHHLHGGEVGFDRRVWKAGIVRRGGGEALRLAYRSLEGEEGYPGNVDVAVTYAVTDDNALRIEYEATTDQATPLSLTNHSYFNLQGEPPGDIRSHELQILAGEFTPVGADFSHTGQRRPVAGLANDFRAPATIGSRLAELFGSHGDVYLMPRRQGRPLLAARVLDPGSGRTMDVLTTEACLQFYTGVSLDGSSVGRGGRAYGKFAGFCLECHGYPGAPHHPAFGSIILYPGQAYRQETLYRFGSTESDHLPPG